LFFPRIGVGLLLRINVLENCDGDRISLWVMKWLRCRLSLRILLDGSARRYSAGGYCWIVNCSLSAGNPGHLRPYPPNARAVSWRCLNPVLSGRTRGIWAEDIPGPSDGAFFFSHEVLPIALRWRRVACANNRSGVVFGPLYHNLSARVRVPRLTLQAAFSHLACPSAEGAPELADFRVRAPRGARYQQVEKLSWCLRSIDLIN